MKTALAISTDEYDIYGNATTLRRSYQDTTPFLWRFEWVNGEGTVVQQADIHEWKMIECLRMSGWVVTK